MRGWRSLFNGDSTAVVEHTCTSAEAMGSASTSFMGTLVGTLASIVRYIEGSHEIAGAHLNGDGEPSVAAAFGCG